MKRIEKSFNSYAQVALPEGCSKAQKIEVHKAFYAGVITVFSAVLQTSELDEDKAEKVLRELQTEVDEFVNALQDLQQDSTH